MLRLTLSLSRRLACLLVAVSLNALAGGVTVEPAGSGSGGASIDTGGADGEGAAYGGYGRLPRPTSLKLKGALA
jgi:hypothetical protein